MNVNKIKSYRDNVLREAKRLMIENLHDFAETMATNAFLSEKTPRDIPNMALTISYAVIGDEAIVFTQCGYGGWVHEGHFMATAWGRPVKRPRFIDGQPFFLWAFDQTVAELS